METAMTPAEELRTAAATLRALAAEATPGPWEGRGKVDASIWANSIGNYVTEKITSGERHKADAHYIAAMHPGVGDLIAKWLTTWVGIDFRDDAALPEDAQHAIAIARAINSKP